MSRTEGVEEQNSNKLHNSMPSILREATKCFKPVAPASRSTSVQTNLRVASCQLHELNRMLVLLTHERFALPLDERLSASVHHLETSSCVW
mmetsp:Transcript_29328/g.113654  ORF Transcript_29328/g.113654 Transcript_29328/m.113654 type:complete len:91 (+) Transcript_29328:400-672(+)